MMDWIIGRLKSVGIIPPDGEIDAEIDRAAQRHGQAVLAMRRATERRRASNDAMRCAIHEAKERSSALGDFEDLIHRGIKNGSADRE